MLIAFALATAVQFVMGVVFIVLVRGSCEGTFVANAIPES